MYGRGKKEEAEELKRKVAESAARIEELSKEEKEVEEKLKQNMMIIRTSSILLYQSEKMTVRM